MSLFARNEEPSMSLESGDRKPKSERRHTLGDIPAGQRGIVLALEGGHIFRSRAANLGFTAGALVSVVQNYGHGPILVAVRGTLVALGRDEASQVFVNSEKEAEDELLS